MCKFNPKNEGRRIDTCLVNLIAFLNQRGIKTISSCCGHGKYPLTLIVKGLEGDIMDVVSRVVIPREKRFYKRDMKGYYFIPEVLNEHPPGADEER